MQIKREHINLVESCFKAPVNFLKELIGSSGDKTYLISKGNHLYVAKCLDQSSSSHEIHCYTEAAKRGFSPKVVICSDSRLLVSEYIYPIKQETSLMQIMQVLRTLHESSCDFLNVVSPCDRVLEFLNESAEGDDYIESELVFLKAALSPHLVLNKPCHFDINDNNFLYDGNKVFLIDWSDAAISDELYDVASFCFYRRLQAIDQKKVLKCYGCYNSHNRKKLYLLTEVACLMMMAWSLSRDETVYCEAKKYYTELQAHAFHQDSFLL